MKADLLAVDEARRRLIGGMVPLVAAEDIALDAAVGRVLAMAVHAEADHPSFANSSMDGFAVRAADVAGAAMGKPVTLRVVGDAPAGRASPITVGPGEAIRIMTGAMVPEGADAVVPVEQTDAGDRSQWGALPDRVTVLRGEQTGANIRPRGQDIRDGDAALASGKLIGPKEAGLLAMLGYDRVSAIRKPRTAALATGDELRAAGTRPEVGAIYDSNSPMVSALLVDAGADVVRRGKVGDDAAEIRNWLDAAVEDGVDLIVSTAGVSVGSYDYVRDVLMKYGSLEGWRVNMRPGKPLAFGRYREVPFVGLPGNPVSAFVGFEVFVRPALRQLAGETGWQRRRVRARLAEAVESDGRESYLRGTLEDAADGSGPVARLAGHQGSGNLFGLSQSNALIVLAAGVQSMEEGQLVEVWPIS
ncbi:MAG: molybdopterin molybdenumtransferase MoeA [Anaerolineae bacterium]|nr:MAG: molybdopterin molybdenumtransferase MoeA [Anaerolineae bacterium]